MAPSSIGLVVDIFVSIKEILAAIVA